MPGRHRRVRREDDLRRDAPERFPRVDAFGLHPLADQLERGERAVPFVEVDDAGRDAQRVERAHAADAEQQLLADADAIVAAVEPRGQLAILRAGCRRRSNRAAAACCGRPPAVQTRAAIVPVRVSIEIVIGLAVARSPARIGSSATVDVEVVLVLPAVADPAAA